MTRQIYVNLPVQNLARAKAFFGQLGFGFEPKFTDDNAACMIVGDDAFVMLLVEPFFRTFIKKELCNARRATEVLVALSCSSRAEVDDLAARALAGGGRVPREPQDHGFMYSQAFEDLDGHVWELIHMVPEPAGGH